MPESIRSLLHDIGDDHAEPERDLAAGAYRKARSMTRKRIAAGAATVAAALAIAGTGTAAWLGDEHDPGPGPAEQSTTESPEEVTTSEGEPDEGSNCTVSVKDWDDLDFTFPARGDSGTAGPLTALPDGMLFRGYDAEAGEATYLVSDGGATVLDAGDYLYEPAPDGDRSVWIDRASTCGGVYAELGDSDLEALPVFSMDTVACPITWSPDSNRVIFTETGPEEGATTGFHSYVLDVSTGELTDLPEELYCTAKWLPDGEHLWDDQGTVMRYDGTEPVDVPELGEGDNAMYYIASGMSADMGEACVHQTEGDSHGWRCDKYFDMETGEEIDLPVVGGFTQGETRQVEFLEDGSMLILNQTPTAATVYLVGPGGELVDEMALPQGLLTVDHEIELLSWYTG
ncbi:hypothetical protein [Glycomyces artemisiae]|uniref:Uncharacterized protein n=1 Tax=Glycomyces artemisiae TaxID=1076443 RepID=A0A2T0UKF2_9ACTN|nr:hypothetical protein [Glycomyces artemisiae]PRY58413.1 hypothetical protein B0I28_105126 [Glycomyces artemisiae]